MRNNLLQMSDHNQCCPLLAVREPHENESFCAPLDGQIRVNVQRFPVYVHI
jgi:hypothetical protein